MFPPLFEPSGDFTAAALLSGTSQDGLDVAFYRITPSPQEPLRPHMRLLTARTHAFPEKLAGMLRHLSFRADAPVRDLLQFEQHFALFCVNVLQQNAESAGLNISDLHFIATHGQTLYHEKLSRSAFRALSLQLAGADYLASKLGCAVVSDFRTRHIAEGGEGAPLAPILDYLYWQPEAGTRIMLNLGGIANITVLRAGASLAETAYGDTGPANKLMDQLMQRDGGAPWDAGGVIAASGQLQQAVLELLLREPYFALPFPKSTGPELFNLTETERRIRTAGLPVPSFPDFMATLSALTATTVADAISRLCNSAVTSDAGTEILVSGGGAKNAHLLRQIELLTELPLRIAGSEREADGDETASGSLTADFKETQLFALLGYLTLYTQGAEIFRPGQPVRLAKISLP
ncbi:anhydro-N-acetylmuramic acid kinase [Cyclonatronum proteinivorum]|uniref:Anhydro-N-acetylmuramic acid kinase n=1 Tax=Cyclonatronum proteinivorum TaxID=1457365 RepID=A0A345UJK2_9BACT|nr:anhydro-N-acetylmuramic acid kinase [Cyclonatronum proteinivorum]AXJ00654.1 anhydro-N-acetylmuramic acid kinase [Cyclonatronum proteinivorum]